ncbi:hypothetical protein GCM10022226_79270 [Sphaerisporangium flaviroseum]|uniref:Uncharacterized protein n=2 Tax=Sphaerisporangium flaviroseum TaxID=509199 RepID=A0ABP7JH67_9ACTN
MATSALDPQTMRRLAFIRLLHQQGIEQSRSPQPLSFTSVLTFHDAIELFCMLTSERVGVDSPKGNTFVQRYFDGLQPDKNDGRGVILAGRAGVKRITDMRNAFKHANAWPGAEGLEQSRADAAAFFDENTPKVFGIEYAAIDMADLIPQEEVRDLVREAAAVESSGSRIEAMALLVDAGNAVSREHLGQGRDRTSFSFGPNLRVGLPLAESDIARMLRSLDGYGSVVHEFAEQIATLTKITLETQHALRVMTLGVDYHAYLKFLRLTPIVNYSINGERSVHHPAALKPTAEDYAFCQQLVISMALRSADIQSHLTTTPS